MDYISLVILLVFQGNYLIGLYLNVFKECYTVYTSKNPSTKDIIISLVQHHLLTKIFTPFDHVLTLLRYGRARWTLKKCRLIAV